MNEDKKKKEYSRSLTERGNSVGSTIPDDIVKLEAAKAGISLLDFILNYETVFTVEPGLHGKTTLSFRRRPQK